MSAPTLFAERARQMGTQVVEAPVGELLTVLSDASAGFDGGIALSSRVGTEFPALAPLARASADPAEVVISDAPWGIVSTGSVLLADTYEDRRLGLLSFRHIVLLPSTALLPSIEDAASVVRGWIANGTFRYVTYATGPSRTSDIERVLTIGVHGPKELVVVLVDEWERADD